MLDFKATEPQFHVAPESVSCMLPRKRFIIFESWSQLPMNTRISVVLRVAIVVVCGVLVFQGKPPAYSQQHANYITSKDEAQDVQLGQLSDFKSNQQAFNAATEAALQKLADKEAASEGEIQSIEGWEKGGFGVLTALSILAMFFQLKRKDKSE